MQTTLGKKIAQYRKEKGMTQEGLAEQLNISPQAVSKWENDISCPDILLLSSLAELLDVTVDELLSNKPKPEVTFVPEKQRKKLEEMILTIRINSDGDKVNINLPMPFIKVALEMGLKMSDVSENLKGIDVEQIMKLAENGLMGTLLEVDSDGDTVEIIVR